MISKRGRQDMEVLSVEGQEHAAQIEAADPYHLDAGYWEDVLSGREVEELSIGGQSLDRYKIVPTPNDGSSRFDYWVVYGVSARLNDGSNELVPHKFYVRHLIRPGTLHRVLESFGLSHNGPRVSAEDLGLDSYQSKEMREHILNMFRANGVHETE